MLDIRQIIGPDAIRMSGSGRIQAQRLAFTAPQRVFQYVPDTLPISGVDYSQGVEITTLTQPATHFTSGYWKYGTGHRPPA